MKIQCTPWKDAIEKLITTQHIATESADVMDLADLSKNPTYKASKAEEI